MSNIRVEEVSGGKKNRGGLLELAVDEDTLVVTHIGRLSKEVTYGLQVIEDLHLGGVSTYSIIDPVKGEN